MLVMRRGVLTSNRELWSCSIDPEDCALRNIVWDEDEKKW